METLPPHDWDDEAHRAQIHEAFDKWFMAYMQKNCWKQEARWRVLLKQLTAEAEVRRLTLEGAHEWA